ncbi:MAG: ubiquitinyl hydrolase 1 [Geoglossum simile]|nr:MAG: ubiquitinyl hydrolase 1 [Geoglossum simile]
MAAEGEAQVQAPQHEGGSLSGSAKKSFIPLENNPEVMTTLVHSLGLSRRLSFHDVFTIDDPDLLAFVPRPAYALLLVFPCSDTYEKFRREEDTEKEDYTGFGEGEPVVWYRQTIKNACGLIGLLHGVSNGEARDFIKSSSDLDHLLKSAIPLSPGPRADLLYNSPALESAHQSAAVLGDTAAPDAEDKIDLHFVCFVKSKHDSHLWELDGRRKGPLDRGVLGPEDDVLCEKALQMGIRGFLKREEQSGAGEMRFSLIVLSPSLE